MKQGVHALVQVVLFPLPVSHRRITRLCRTILIALITIGDGDCGAPAVGRCRLDQGRRHVISLHERIRETQARPGPNEFPIFSGGSSPMWHLRGVTAEG